MLDQTYGTTVSSQWNTLNEIPPEIFFEIKKRWQATRKPPSSLLWMPGVSCKTLVKIQRYLHTDTFYFPVSRLYVLGFLIRPTSISKRSFDLLVFGPYYSARDLWSVLHFPICIKVLLIALISSDEWWLLFDWIFTINAFFIHTP